MKLISTLLFLFFFLFSIDSNAATFGFDCITNNNAGNCGNGEGHLLVDVTNSNNGTTLFTFTNNGSGTFSITQIYWDDSLLSNISQIINAIPDVKFFSENIHPSNLPGGNSINFQTTFALSADNPTPHYGVNPGESLGIEFNLKDGKCFDDVLNNLDSGTLRIGLHVQSFDNFGSESFVNDPKPVPEPTTMLLLGSGLIGLAGLVRRKFRKII